MPRPKTTDADRVKRTAERVDLLKYATDTAMEALSDPSVTAAERQALWADVATLAGNVQRDTRILAGLGRGG